MKEDNLRISRFSRPCLTCGKTIYFKKTYEGKLIPFDIETGYPHFETCTKPPTGKLKPSYDKPKIKYKTISNNKKLEAYE